MKIYQLILINNDHYEIQGPDYFPIAVSKRPRETNEQFEDRAIAEFDATMKSLRSKRKPPVTRKVVKTETM